MKTAMMVGTFVAFMLFIATPAVFAQQPGQQVQPQGGWWCPWMSGWQGGQGGWFCPWCGTGMGPGMMHRGYGGGDRGYGMRHHGGPGMMPGWQGQGGQPVPPGRSSSAPLTEDRAKMLLENYLANTGNPNLKLGEIASRNGFYEAEIVTKDGSLVDKIQVDKNTGWFRSAY